MHPDLPKLLEVQVKDRVLAGLNERAEEIASSRAVLDAVLGCVKADIASATRTATDVARPARRGGEEARGAVTATEQRRAKLDRSGILASPHSCWRMLNSGAASSRRKKATGCASPRRRRSAATSCAVPRSVSRRSRENRRSRAELAQQHDALAGELEAARAEREVAASHLDKTLRLRYDRLRNSRKSEILVPASKATCTACNTAIPKSRVGRLQADGILLDGCEMCGAIIYVAEVVV